MRVKIIAENGGIFSDDIHGENVMLELLSKNFSIAINRVAIVIQQLEANKFQAILKITDRHSSAGSEIVVQYYRRKENNPSTAFILKNEDCAALVNEIAIIRDVLHRLHLFLREEAKRCAKEISLSSENLIETINDEELFSKTHHLVKFS